MSHHINRRTVIGAGLLAASVPTVSRALGEGAMTHVVLFGDSIFDNAAYVRRGEEVLAQLSAKLSADAQATLRAVDGAVIEGVVRQLQTPPVETTHILISAGGNDALRYAPVLMEGARSMADAVGKIADIQDDFRRKYRAMLDVAQRHGLPVAVCTIYEAQLPDPVQRRLAATALSVLNDVITREAASRRLPVIDLRTIFDEPADWANSIEPSGQGGRKIAAAIASLLARHDFSGFSGLYTD